MATADTEASTAGAKALATPASPLRPVWEKIATVLAVIGLVDVTGQLIKWATVIHWIAEKYATVRVWLFGWLPFHIPPEWHDPIVSLLILFSVTNVGVYRRTGRTVYYFLYDDNKENIDPLAHFSPRQTTFIWLISMALSLSTITCIFIYTPSLQNELMDHIEKINLSLNGVWQVVSLPVALIGCTFTTSIPFIFMFVAWRWVLTTATIFVALVLINEAYVLWLAPLAEH
jgi:hypothetical protein